MNMSPANIAVSNARLPQSYEEAKTALAKCASLDECMDWANKAEALASYGKQIDDKTFFNYAMRIKARAVRRGGELLKQFDGRGRNQHTEDSRGSPTKPGISQRAIAKRSGLSKDQQVTAVRVANVPRETFDDVVESDAPPTITKLAEMGINAQPKPEGFTKATHLLGTVKRFAEFCRANDPIFVAKGVLPPEIREVKEHVGMIDQWLDRFVVNLER